MSARVPINKIKSEIRPLYSRLTPHGAVNSRSPMVSLIFPSLRDKIKIFQDDSKKGTEMRNHTSVHLKRRELDIIVEQESKKRAPNDYWNMH
jgi:hypothetical protein